MEGEAMSEVEGDETVLGERLADCEVGFFGCGAEGEDVVL